MLNAIFNAMEKVGRIAVSEQSGIAAMTKPDKSPVTAVDLKASEIIREEIKPFTDLPNHMMVDEEFEQSPKEQWEKFKKAEFAWFIDPISGTLAYMNGLPFYGISVGVLKYGEPHTGAVYFPALNELYWHTEGKAYFKNKDGETTEIGKNDKPITPLSLLYINVHQRFTFPEKICRTISLPAVNPGFLWSAKGNLSGALVKLKVWDMAASWGVCKSVGMDFYGLDDGRKIEKVSEADFDESWKMRQPMILSNSQNIEVIRKNIKPLI